MGKLHYCLGISVIHYEENNRVHLQQKQYILKMLQKYGLSEAKTVSTPADLSITLVKDDDSSKDVDSTYTLHQSMVGSLLYASMATRPDIAQAVGVVSRFNSKPSKVHLTAVKRILRYLKSTVDLALRVPHNLPRTLGC